MDKSPDAFRTISEVSEWLNTPAHVLRFWESRFTQVKPVKRAGGRRYYRPADIALLGGIKKLLHEDGLTIRGVQKILREEGVRYVASLAPPFEEIAAEVAEDLKTVVHEVQPLDAPDTEAEILRFPEAAPPTPPAAQLVPEPAPTATQPDLFQEPAPAPLTDPPAATPVTASENEHAVVDEIGETEQVAAAEGGAAAAAAPDSVGTDEPDTLEGAHARLPEAEPEAPAAVLARETASAGPVPDDPEDHDPAFATAVVPFPIRNPETAAARLRASPDQAQAALRRLRALRDRMSLYAR